MLTLPMKYGTNYEAFKSYGDRTKIPWRIWKPVKHINKGINGTSPLSSVLDLVDSVPVDCFTRGCKVTVDMTVRFYQP